MRSKINVQDFPNNVKWTRCKYPKWEVVLYAQDSVNIPCLMHDIRFSQLDVKIYDLVFVN